MKPKAALLAAIIVLALVAVFGLFFRQAHAPAAVEQVAVQQEHEVAAPSSGSDQNATSSAVFGADPKTAARPNDPWVVFDLFVEYAKAGDVDGIRSVLFQPELVRCDNVTKEQCDNMIRFAYLVTSLAYKPEYVHRWEDDKQIILSTDYKPLGDDAAGQGYERNYLYFAYASDGQLKYLGSHGASWSAVVQEGQTHEEFEEDMQESMRDSDNDGIADNYETCGNGTYADTCKRTDPFDRDTDDDGWWDGTEQRFD